MNVRAVLESVPYARALLEILSMIIGTNMAALRAQNAMRVASAQVQQSMLRLSTGKRINSASDDPAGLAISTRMTAQIRGMTQAVRNAQDGISLAQTAEGTLDSVTSMVQRIRELALQSASGTYSDNDRGGLNAEVTQLVDEIRHTLSSASFNGVSLFNITGGSGTAVPIQVGTGAGQMIDIAIDNMDMSSLSATTIASSAGADAAITTMAGFLDKLAKARAGLGAVQNRLEASVSNLTTSIVNLTEANSRIMDVDFAAESMALAKAQITLQASTAMLAQANQTQRLVLELLR